MVVGQSRNRRHLIGTSISKSFLVFHRLISFNFAILLDRYGKADPGRNHQFVDIFCIVAGPLRQSGPRRNL
jgi:hypothetical protein